MQLLTDRAFRDVFSKLKLKEFHLQSLDPLEKVKTHSLRYIKPILFCNNLTLHLGILIAFLKIVLATGDRGGDFVSFGGTLWDVN